MLAAVVTVGLLAAVVLGLIWSQQRRLIYFPWPGRLPAASSVLTGSQEIVVETEDGIHLGGWFLPAQGDSPAPAVLVCNGNGGNRALRAPLATALSRAGLSVLLFDYRGYGGNPGRPSEDGLAADARAAQAWLAARPEVDPGRIAYYGESLGAAVALRLAVERPPAALILRSPFTSPDRRRPAALSLVAGQVAAHRPLWVRRPGRPTDRAAAGDRGGKGTRSCPQRSAGGCITWRPPPSGSCWCPAPTTTMRP
jgi:fermentation-respiration switch protein FrsA (DUF1100 family)